MSNQNESVPDINDSLPQAARSLCTEAADLASDLVHQLEKEEFLLHIPAALENVLKATTEAKSISLTALKEKKSFNYSDIFSYPLHDEEFIETLKSSIPSISEQNSIEGLSPQKAAALHEFTIISIYIALISTLEKRFINEEGFSYSQFMDSIDGAIFQLHTVCHAIKSTPILLERVESKISKSKGGKKGAKARSARSETLKKVVIEELEDRFTSMTSAGAARSIYEKLGPDSTWLKDDEGRNILRDPVPRFTQWIRDHRRRMTHDEP